MAALIVCICISSLRFLLLMMLAPRHLKVTIWSTLFNCQCFDSLAKLFSIRNENIYIYILRII